MQWVAKQAPHLLLSTRVPTQPFPTVGTGKGFSTSLRTAECLASFCLFKMSPSWEVSVLHHIFGNFFRARQVVSLCRLLIPPCADLTSRINTSPERPVMSCMWRSCYLLPSFPKFPMTLCTLSDLRSSLWCCQLLLQQMQNILKVYLHRHVCILYIYISLYIYECIYVYILKKKSP